MCKRLAFIFVVVVCATISIVHLMITARYMTVSLECADVYKIGQPVIVTIRGAFHGPFQRDWDRQFEFYEIDSRNDKRIFRSWSRLLYPRPERGERFFPNRSLDEDHSIYFLALVPRSTEPKRTIGLRLRWRDLGVVWRTVESNICVIRTEEPTSEEYFFFSHIADPIESWYRWPGLDIDNANLMERSGSIRFIDELDIDAYLQSTNAVISQHAMLTQVFGFIPSYFRSKNKSGEPATSEALFALAAVYDELSVIRGGNRSIRDYAEHMATTLRSAAERESVLEKGHWGHPESADKTGKE